MIWRFFTIWQGLLWNVLNLMLIKDRRWLMLQSAFWYWNDLVGCKLTGSFECARAQQSSASTIHWHQSCPTPSRSSIVTKRMVFVSSTPACSNADGRCSCHSWCCGCYVVASMLHTASAPPVFRLRLRPIDAASPYGWNCGAGWIWEQDVNTEAGGGDHGLSPRGCALIHSAAPSSLR